MSEFEFTQGEDGPPTMETMVYEAVGAASTCWESLHGTGVFDSDRAQAIGDAVVEQVVDPLYEALGDAWGLLANVSEGDWEAQPQEWQEAVTRWRDQTWHPLLARRREQTVVG